MLSVLQNVIVQPQQAQLGIAAGVLFSTAGGVGDQAHHPADTDDRGTDDSGDDRAGAAQQQPTAVPKCALGHTMVLESHDTTGHVYARHGWTCESCNEADLRRRPCNDTGGPAECHSEERKGKRWFCWKCHENVCETCMHDRWETDAADPEDCSSASDSGGDDDDYDDDNDDDDDDDDPSAAKRPRRQQQFTAMEVEAALRKLKDLRRARAIISSELHNKWHTMEIVLNSLKTSGIGITPTVTALLQRNKEAMKGKASTIVKNVRILLLEKRCTGVTAKTRTFVV